MAMGFSENGSKRAALATGNSSAEASMEWVFAHMEDPDFNDPLPPPGKRRHPPPWVWSVECTLAVIGTSGRTREM
eukprot:1177557-Prorocentrum_minimum.AAC.6